MPAPEPRVLTEDVRGILTSVIHPDDSDFGEAVQNFSERAHTSTRTIYRVLGRKYHSLALPLADQLVTAAGRHLSECDVLLADGRVVPYSEAP